MRQVILQEFVSLDRLAAGPKTIGTILPGRVTYRMFADYWPTATTDTDKAADMLNETPKIVFSKTLNRAPWGKWAQATVVKTDAAEAVAELRAQSGKDMVLWGSISLAQSLMKAGLIDQYQLVVCPWVLGSGTPLFGDGAPGLELKLLETRQFDHGTVALKYTPSVRLQGK
jgi:dihydrofolate reductase